MVLFGFKVALMVFLCLAFVVCGLRYFALVFWIVCGICFWVVFRFDELAGPFA